MLNLRREDLAGAANVAPSTLFDFESGRRHPHSRTLEALRIALEAAGVEFIAENGGGPGVRLRQAGVSSADTPAPEHTGIPAAPAAHELRSVGPEDEARGGHEAPAPGLSPTARGTGKRRAQKP